MGAPCESRGPFGYPRLLPANCQSSHERGGQSLVQEYSPRRRGLSISLAALFRCRRLIGRPSLRSCAIGLRGVEMSEEQKVFKLAYEPDFLSPAPGWGQGVVGALLSPRYSSFRSTKSAAQGRSRTCNFQQLFLNVSTEFFVVVLQRL